MEAKDTGMKCKYKINIHHAMVSRRGYSNDIEETKMVGMYRTQEQQCNRQRVESPLMMHSFVIKLRGNKADLEVIQ